MKKDKESKKSKKSLFLGILVMVLSIASGVCSVLVPMILSVGITTDTKIFATADYDYDCSSTNEQVEATNKSSLDYYSKSIKGNYKDILISPLSVQGSIYKYYNKDDRQKPELFKFFGNGKNTWKQSGEIFNNASIISYMPDVIDTEDTLIGKAEDDSSGFLKVLGDSKTYKKNTLYSIFQLSSGIRDGVYNSKNEMICYNGGVEYKKVKDYEAVKLELTDLRYSLYLVKGDISSFNTDGFKKKYATVKVGSYTWQSYGKLNELAKELGYAETDLVVLNQFGFSNKNHRVVNRFKATEKEIYTYKKGYSALITDSNTGLILAVGKHG